MSEINIQYTPPYMSSQPQVSSRLAKKETKKALRQTIYIVLLTVGLGLLFFFVILPAVIRFTIPGGQTQTLGGNTVPPQVPSLSAPQSATNSATIALSGYAEKASNVVLVVNGAEVTSIPVTSDDGQFSLAAPITEGENSLSLFAKDDQGNKSASSKIYTVRMDTVVPTIELESPTNGATIELAKNQLTTIKGKTEPEAMVTIDGRTVRASAEGVFSTTKQLQEGENKILLIAKDLAGNETQLEITVTFKR